MASLCNREKRKPFSFLRCCCLVAQLCPTLCNPMDCSPPGSSVHGIFQARVLEWVAISFSRGSSRPQGLNLDLLHCGQMLYCLSHQGSPECSKQPETCSENMLYMAFILFLIFSIFIPSSGEGNGNPLQDSCLENPVDGGAWWAAVYRIAESDTTEAT